VGVFFVFVWLNLADPHHELCSLSLLRRAFETEEELDVALTATSDWVAGTGEFEGLDGPAGGGPDVFDGNLIHSEKYEISFKILCSDGMVPTSFSYSYSMSM